MKIAINTAEAAKRIKRFSLPFQPNFLNFKESSGTSATRAYDKRKTKK